MKEAHKGPNSEKASDDNLSNWKIQFSFCHQLKLKLFNLKKK